MLMTEVNPQKKVLPPLRAWRCRKPGCNRILMEHSIQVGLEQVIRKLCDKCGTENLLINGLPQT